VRGAFVITGYGGVLALHLVGSVLGATTAVAWMGSTVGAALAVMTAVYTAFLFAQAKARDLWQSPLGGVHFFVHTVLLGAGVLVLLGLVEGGPAGGATAADVRTALLWTLSLSAWAHLALALLEHTLTHVTAHARLAAEQMRNGRWAVPFRASAVLMILCGLAPWLGPLVALAGLAGVLLYEHAYVQAGQSVPLA
jgi:formate-dependent nitrite reductase membrane component NrfD